MDEDVDDDKAGRLEFLVAKILERTVKKQIAGVDGECWEWQGAKGGGYYGLMWDPTLQDRVYTHSIACEYKHGARPKGKRALHICNNQICNNWDHLYWGTCVDNHKDSVKAGTAAYKMSLTEKQAGEIKWLWLNTDMSRKEIAKKYNVTVAVSNGVIGGRNYVRVKPTRPNYRRSSR